MILSTSVPVAIAGGGPVGLMLALFLDHYNVRSVVFNTEASVPSTPRGSTHNARTMEHYRTLGLSGQVRRLGLPWDHATDITFATRYTRFPLARLTWPSPGDAMRRIAVAERTDQTPEPMHRANQMYVEKLLLEQARTRPNITLCFGWRVRDIEEHADSVSVTAERDGETAVHRVGRLVGCDGGRSTVRHALGIRYQGPGSLDQAVLGRRATAAHLRIPSLYREVFRGRKSWSYWAFNPDIALNLIALDGIDEFFLLTSSVDPDSADDGAIVRLVHEAVGLPVPITVLSRRGWTPGAALVAERFQAGRIFLAGDAAHLFTPNGGFGMNTGVDDVANLAWKLAACTQGWAESALLETYEAERRPIALRNTAAARELNIGLGAIERPAELDDDTVAGAAVRQRIGSELAEYGQLTLDTLGVQLGARYDDSPLTAEDPESPPPDRFDVYVPSGVPGGRAPHVWMRGPYGRRRSLFDEFGTGFTLLRVGDRPPATTDLLAAAAEGQVPMTVVDVRDEAARDLYGRDLVLVRPDQHIAWRGNQLPSDARSLIELVTGRRRHVLR